MSVSRAADSHDIDAALVLERRLIKLAKISSLRPAADNNDRRVPARKSVHGRGMVRLWLRRPRPWLCTASIRACGFT